MAQAHFLGTGGFVPERVVTNDDLREVYGIDTDDAWIRTRTGIGERRYADEGTGTADLAAKASRLALASAGLEASDLDLIVLCTLSPDRAFPGSSVYLQALLGLPEAGHFTACVDVRAQCSGFLYGLAVATGMIRGGIASRVLLVGAEVQSAGLDLSTRGRSVAALFGDGAGAVVLGAGPEGRGVGTVRLGADGRFADQLSQAVWDMRARPFIPVDDEGYGRVAPERLWAHMDGPLVFRHAVERMSAVVLEVLEAEGLQLHEVDWFAFHQANLRVNVAVAERLGLPPERLLHNIQRYGNTTAATIPLLLDEAARDGRIVAGMTVVCASFGSGFTWGGAVLRW